ncbi:ATP-dependent DNA ligase Cdc17 [Ceratocystis pirilliformis]|uniref:DNA ligase n=1 Tax=Ceratocystis pirilliformis TaxID=259994 RepID=A0ABR3Z1E7_9PEZI
MTAPKQSTLGKFFNNANGSRGPQQQTKLSFSTKAKPKKENAVPDAALVTDREASPELSTTSEKETKKRSRKAVPKKESPGSDAEMEDGPLSKRPRCKRPRVDSDGSDADVGEAKAKPNAEAETAVKTEVESGSCSSPKKSRGKSASPKKSPKKAAIVASVKAEEVEEDSSADISAGESPGSDNDIVDVAVRKTVQAKIINAPPTATPYPDWKIGDPVPYAGLCTTFSLVELTTKRLIIMEYCSLFLRQVLRLTPDDLLLTVLLMINKLAPDYAGIELGIGESLIMKSIGETTGRSLAVIKQDQKEMGDLGLVAVKSRATQRTMFKPKPLTVRGIHKGLMDIATMSGTGVQGRKVDCIKKLLAAADSHNDGKVDITKDKGGPSEAKFIVRFLEGKLRLGLAERTVIVSLAQAMVCHEAEAKGQTPSTADLEKAEQILKTVYSELPSYNVIIPAMLAHGIMNLREHCKLRPGVPLKPMLAKPTKAITEVLDRFTDQTFTCEFKYDGERAQIHYVAKDAHMDILKATPGAVCTQAAATGITAIFSRNSEDLSKKYPDILSRLHAWIKPETKSFVLDCETVAWDVAEKKVLPFQTLMTRKKKDVKIEDVKIKVCVFAFDLLYLNGEAVVEKSLRERRELLRNALVPTEGEFALATSMDSRELEDIQTFLDDSVKASCEGLMVKMLDGTESGYEPSKRSRNWLKIKKDYLSGIGDSLDLVVLGAYHGKGKRTSVYGAFLLACYNPSTEVYETVCNIGTGFSEQVLEELHAELSKMVIDRPKPFYAHLTGSQHQPDVWFEPRFVWEVKTADLTLSPRYKAGMHERVDPAGEKGISLRFPRFIKVRDDKKPDEATSSRQVAEMYLKQESVTKNKGPSVDDDFEY